ncbi:MAG: pirin family protein [Deltaproteobacteria bacterium]|nr:MAG: pirin family protein [Deltaproteobacteria bacterium]
MHHHDAYPKGDARMAPVASLAGRRMGQDFSGRDGWSMYHGQVVPGFPRHPHRGFETVTISRQGYIDHADSLGATARYGGGDVQWLTAGGGISHAEMFPLRETDADNPLELFQIWLNLPRKNKMVAPYFKMMWREGVPVHRFADEAGRVTEVKTIAGALGGRAPESPPPDSWAAHEDAHVAIWTLTFEPGARWVLPAVPEGVRRTLYVHDGDAVEVAGVKVEAGHRGVLEEAHAAPLVAGPGGAHALLLQGRPIGEPVVTYGPFVMNTRQEIQQAFDDYRKDGFGGWPWPDDAPVHARERDRFAIHIDGTEDVPT